MDFLLSENTAEFGDGFRELLAERGYGCKGGISVVMKLEEQKLTVQFTGTEAVITAPKKVYAFRGLMLLVMKLEKQGTAQAFSITEEVHFEDNGAMVDCSRNCVMSIPAAKAWIRMQAAVGMNILMLYTEDTYEVPEYPYFGALRSRYKKEEIQELDRYAQLFGIELIPCIQTLGHLQQPLKWPAMMQMRDTSDILMVGEERTYAFLRACLKRISECFTTKRIHLGMDEAWTLGLGKYLIQKGFTAKDEIMREHLERIMELCREFSFEPMMWSDMYFRVHSETEDYFDVPHDKDITTKAMPPKEMALIYWDYYHARTEFYEAYIQLHRQLSDKLWFAGGGWTWNGTAPALKTAYTVTRASMAACRKERLRHIFYTLWGDDATETPLFSALGPVILCAEYGFGDIPGEERIKEKFEFLTGYSYEAYQALGAFDVLTEEAEEDALEANPSKNLFYQDILAGIYDGQLEGKPIGSYYGQLKERIAVLGAREPEHVPGQVKKQFWGTEMRRIMSYYSCQAQILAGKSDMGLRIRMAYDCGNTAELRRIAKQEIPVLVREINECRRLRETIWMQEGRVLGWEVLDIRFRALAGRLESAAERLMCYVDGKIPSLPEVEEPRLPLFPEVSGARRLTGHYGSWVNIVSASPLAWEWLPQS